jgi:hypothetical protein
MTLKLAGVIVAALACPAGMAGAQTRGPVPLPPPTIYAAPTLAPLVPPINPGPAVVPPAGLSPLLTEPGPIYQLPEREGPSYPPPPTPGPIDQQKTQSYRNGLRDQQWQLQRQGVSPGSERSREIEQQLNPPGSR